MIVYCYGNEISYKLRLSKLVVNDLDLGGMTLYEHEFSDIGTVATLKKPGC